MEVRRITSFRAFDGLREAWNDLLLDAERANPFLSHQWFEAWWRNFGSEQEPEVLVLEECGNRLTVWALWPTMK